MVELADGRVYKRKRIKDPSDANNYIDIPVIYEARFKTMQEQAQENVLYFNNSLTSSRKVHTHRVTNPNDESQYVDVERIDEWYSKTVAEQAQERTHVLKNIDPPPMQPDGSNSPSHEKTHIVRYFAANVGGQDRPYVDIELIDELRIMDATSQYQEWIWYTKHPELGQVIDDPEVPYTVTQAYCDPSFEMAPDESALGIDPPYRLDIFQNIINVNWNPEIATTVGYGIVWEYPRWGTDHVWTAFYVQYPGDPPPPELASHEVVATFEVTREQFDNLVGGYNLRNYFPEIDVFFDQWIVDYDYYLLHPGTPYPEAPIISCQLEATA